MMANAAQRAVTGEVVILTVDHGRKREVFRFFKTTKVCDALSEVVATFNLRDDPLALSLLHCGRVMKEDATIGVSPFHSAFASYML